MYKRYVLLRFVAIFLLCESLQYASLAAQQQNPVLNGNGVNWLGAGMDAFRAMTISERQIMMQASQYAAQSDAQNRLAAPNDPYSLRLRSLTARHGQDNGLRLNYRVYLSPMVNAFALADGTVRVYSGLMDMMTDEEILGVIGHEIGHVKNGDHKDKLRTALLTSAARKAAAGSNSMLGQLAVSQAGAIAEALVNAKFSRSQEIDADDYGLDFVKRNGYNPRAMVTALAKLAKLGAGRSNAVQQMFSTHPDPQKRAVRMAKMAGMATR
jgi:metalloprotease